MHNQIMLIGVSYLYLNYTELENYLGHILTTLTFGIIISVILIFSDHIQHFIDYHNSNSV